MPDIPPTSPGPLALAPPRHANRILLGILIHGGIVFITCFLVPLAMNSNIWPIAGVFWSVMTVPVAVGTGALMGWMMKKRNSGVAFGVLMLSGIALAIVVGAIMANNR